MIKNYIFILLIITFVHDSAYAISQNKSFYKNQETQDKFLERQRKQHEIEKLMREPIEKNETSINPILTPEKKEGTIIITGIIIDFDGKNTDIVFSDIYNNYINKPLYNVDIFELIKKLTARLYDEGYSTSAIVIKQPAIINGVLQLKINWGMLESSRVNGKIPSGYRENAMLETALMNKNGSVLNIHDIDQAIENMNNGFKIAKMKITAGSDYGMSIVDYYVDYNRFPKFSFRLDNTGQSDDYTPFRYMTNINLGDLLIPNDTFSFGGNFKDYSDKKRMEYGYNYSYSIPIGFNRLTMSSTFSKTESPFIIAERNFPYLSENTTYSAKLSRNLYRSNVGKLGVYSEIKSKDSKTTFDGLLLDANSLNYSDLTLGMDALYRPGDVSIYADLSYTQGADFNNGVYSAYDNYNAIDWVRKINGTINYTMPVISDRTTFKSIFSFQYTNQSLVSNYQLTLGDEYSIRGLNSKTAINGDSGFYLNNTLEHIIFVPFQQSQIILTPYVGIDYGFLRENLTNRNASLASVSTGLNINISTVDLSFIYGQVIVSESKKPNGVFYFSGGISF